MIPSKVPKDTENVLLVLNGREPAKVRHTSRHKYSLWAFSYSESDSKAHTFVSGWVEKCGHDDNCLTLAALSSKTSETESERLAYAGVTAQSRWVHLSSHNEFVMFSFSFKIMLLLLTTNCIYL